MKRVLPEGYMQPPLPCLNLPCAAPGRPVRAAPGRRPQNTLAELTVASRDGNFWLELSGRTNHFPGLSRLKRGKRNAKGHEAVVPRHRRRRFVPNRVQECLQLLEIGVVGGRQWRLRNRLVGRARSQGGNQATVELDHAPASANLESGSEAGGIHPSRFDVSDCAAIES